jgi:inner membrane protein
METVIQNVWSKSKVLIKALIIGFLVLLLQIPLFYVKDLIQEREARQREAITEVSSKWAGRQNITGPLLVLPYWQNTGDTAYVKSRSKQYAYFLPDVLNVQSTVTPQEKYRGIYKVMLYNTSASLSGTFNEVEIAKLNIAPTDIIWNEAFIKLKLKWKNQQLALSPLTESSGTEGLMTNLNLTSIDDLKAANFETSFNLSGSEQLVFTPVGKSTTVQVTSKWPHPSFNGNILPQTTQVKKDGFTATWKSLAHKRAFPQQWKGDAYSVRDEFLMAGTSYSRNMDVAASATATNLSSAAFGVNLFVPVNSYQKTMRSVKYAALCILLTFAAFFIIETTNKRSVHPFHYGLVGVALVLFYTLLLSFSEYIGFNASYAIASFATISLIGWFVKGLLQSGRMSILLSTILLLLYTYVFTILQLQDYSLLLGSIGLFITLGVIMYFSRKIQW